MPSTLLYAASFLAPGMLFLVGGGTTPDAVPMRFIEACGGPTASIIVLPQAAADASATKKAQVYLERFGAKNVWTLNANDLTPEQRSDLETRLSSTKGIWVPGGVQARIVQRLGKAWLDAHIKPLIEAGVHYFGTSAGAMVCSNPMIEGPDGEGKARTGPGMGLTQWVVDTHFRERGREARLRHALEKTGQKFGLGISEREWVVIQGDKVLETHGEPLVIKPPIDQKVQRLRRPLASDPRLRLRTRTGCLRRPRRGLSPIAWG